jgi:hypothetical protein
MRRTIKTLAATCTIALPTLTLATGASAQTDQVDAGEPSIPAQADGADAAPDAAAEPPPEPVEGSMDAIGGDPASSEKSESVQPYQPGGPEPEAGPAQVVKSDEPEHPIVLDLNLLFGFGNAPVLGAGAVYSENAFVFAPKLSARWVMSRRFWAGVVIPWSTASVDVPGGGSDATTAWGSPQLQGQYNFGDHDAFGGALRVALGLPIAQGNADPTQIDTGDAAQDQVQRLADATGGWVDPELYTPSRLPLSVSGGVVYVEPRYDVFAWTKMVVLFNTGSEIKEPVHEVGTYDLHSVALRGMTQIGGRVWFLEDYSVGLRASLAYNIVRPIVFDSAAGATDPSPVQFSLRPELGGRFELGSLELDPYLGFMIPTGGQLGGHIWGLYAGARALF